MDAKPFRPRGAENFVPAVHQKHKSTGSLASMAAAAASVAAGFRGPAKRAAFGDVTNLAKNNLGGRDDAKQNKLQAVEAAGNAPPLSSVNKENAPHGKRKPTFARPAQRAVPLSSNKQPRTSVAPDAALRLAAASESLPDVRPLQDALSAPVRQEKLDDALLASTAHGIAKEEPGSAALLSQLHSSVEAPALQPRHHKSQPYLKQQPPQQLLLRRTQSRQLERIELAQDQPAATTGDVAAMPSRIIEQPIAEGTYSDSHYSAVERHSLAEVNHSSHLMDASSKLPHIADAPHSEHSVKDNLTQPLSEPEEYWDDEEYDDYDDQDQAYTTAHSFRSREMTSGGVTTLLAPRITTKVERELEAAKIQVQQTRLIDDMEEEMWDVSMVAEYGEEIFEYLRELEIKMQPNPHYMEMQTEIQWSMRSVLMDWLVQVHNRFSLLPETLFLTVNYIDRFLSCKIVSIGKLQLVGATAILVASKYEEINCPSLDEIVYMVDGGYTAEEILKAERFMLSMLSFELGWPGPMSFLRRVSKADDYDLDTRTLAKYFLELTIMDERFVASPPSFLAAGAHCLSRLILKKGDWTKAHVHYSGYTWSQLRSLVTMMIECCDQPRLHHAAIFEKYQDKRFKEASTIVQHALDAGFTLPNHAGPARIARGGPAEDLAEGLQFPSNMLVQTDA